MEDYLKLYRLRKTKIIFPGQHIYKYKIVYWNGDIIRILTVWIGIWICRRDLNISEATCIAPLALTRQGF